MQGLELCRAYFETWGRPMLEREFPELLPLVAAGLMGSGSECLGYDDEISRDHDFEPGFCLLLPEEAAVDRRTAFLLERAYAKLPKTFMGFTRSALSPAGGPRHGVWRTAEFFTEKLGAPDGCLTLQQWLTLSPQTLLEASGGTVFYDGLGEVTAIRQRISRFPEAVRRKRLAGQLLLMHQAGPYNYPRCLARRDPAAAQLALGEYVRHALSTAFLLENVYEPYYKWAFRGLRALLVMKDMAPLLEYLLTADNEGDRPEIKAGLMDDIGDMCLERLRAQGLSAMECRDLSRHACSVNDRIREDEVRLLHILCTV